MGGTVQGEPDKKSRKLQQSDLNRLEAEPVIEIEFLV